MNFDYTIILGYFWHNESNIEVWCMLYGMPDWDSYWNRSKFCSWHGKASTIIVHACILLEILEYTIPLLYHSAVSPQQQDRCTIKMVHGYGFIQQKRSLQKKCCIKC